MESQLTKENLFDQVLARYYLPKAVEAYRAAIDDVASHQPVKGRKENHELPGLLMFYDGQTVLDRIKTRFTTSPDNSLRGEHTIQDASGLQRILDEETDQDHIFTYNSEKGILTRIKTSLKNTYQKPKLFGMLLYDADVNELLEEKLPRDFISSDYLSQPVANAGSRTRAAVVTVSSPTVNPKKSDRVKAIMISQTVYPSARGKSLTGKIAEIGRSGLVREAFFYQDPSHNGPFVDEANHVVGVYRTYAPSEGGVAKKQEYFMSLESGRLKLSEAQPQRQIPSPAPTSQSSILQSYAI